MVKGTKTYYNTLVGFILDKLKISSFKKYIEIMCSIMFRN